MKSRSQIYILAGVFFLVLSACSNSVFDNRAKNDSVSDAEDIFVSGTIIARINGYPITLEDLEEEISNYNSLIPETRLELKITTPEQKINYLKNEVIKRIFLYQEAKSRGIGRDFDIRRALEKIKVQLFVSEIMKREIEEVDVTSSEIEEYYDNLPLEYKKEPDSRKVSEIVVKDKVQANNLLIRLLSGEEFAGLARQYSLASSAAKGGDLGFITSGTKFKEFERVVFSDVLDIGQASSVFKGPEGYYIIKIEAKRDGKEKKSSDMWDDIKVFLMRFKEQERIKELIERLSSGADIEIKEELIRY